MLTSSAVAIATKSDSLYGISTYCSLSAHSRYLQITVTTTDDALAAVKIDTGCHPPPGGWRPSGALSPTAVCIFAGVLLVPVLPSWRTAWAASSRRRGERRRRRGEIHRPALA